MMKIFGKYLAKKKRLEYSNGLSAQLDRAKRTPAVPYKPASPHPLSGNIMIRDGQPYEIFHSNVSPAIQPGTVFKFGNLQVVVRANDVVDTDNYYYWYKVHTNCRGCLFCIAKPNSCFGHGSFGTEYICLVENFRMEMFGQDGPCQGFIFKKIEP